jgi:hypothetical protein
MESEMRLTEEEARGLWCPFARVMTGFDEKVAVNRGDTDEGDRCRCYASHCMAWRWSREMYREGDLLLPRHGYCGLAGEPGGWVSPAT